MIISCLKRILISNRPAIHRLQRRCASGLTYYETKPPQSLGEQSLFFDLTYILFFIIYKLYLWGAHYLFCQLGENLKIWNACSTMSYPPVELLPGNWYL